MNKYVNNLTLPNGTNVLIKDLEGRKNLSNEIIRATAKETELEEADTHLRNDLTTETNARKQSDTALQQNINAEVSAREQGDNKNNAEIAKIHNDITTIENKNTEQDNELSTLRTMISSPYNFKGYVANISSLPASGEVNDTYYVQDVKYKVTWNGSAWVQSSLSEADYQTELSALKSDLDNLFVKKDIKQNCTKHENKRFNISKASLEDDSECDVYEYNPSPNELIEFSSACGGSSNIFANLFVISSEWKVVYPNGIADRIQYKAPNETGVSLWFTCYKTKNFELYKLTDVETSKVIKTFEDITDEIGWFQNSNYNYVTQQVIDDPDNICASVMCGRNDKFMISGLSSGIASLISTVVAEDINGNVLDTLQGGYTLYSNYIYTPPENAVKIWFSFRSDLLPSVKKLVYSDLDSIRKKTDSQWSGKKWIQYGDSITQMAKWQKTVNKKHNFCISLNKGIGGTTISNNGTSNYFANEGRLTALPTDYDLIHIMGGTNDFGQSIPIGDLSYPFNTSTFKGALAYVITRLQSLMPNTRIVVSTLVSGGGGSVSSGNTTELAKNNLNLTPEDYANATIDVCNYLSIPCIDLYHNCGINPFNRAKYMLDSVHPNDLGGKVIGEIIANGLENISPIN